MKFPHFDFNSACGQMPNQRCNRLGNSVWKIWAEVSNVGNPKLE
jgi:hypothetical protein